MSEHILKKSHVELERTHSLLEKYKTSGIKEIFFSIFGTSFKSVLFRYAHKKEEILMNYSSLYSDFLKDINNSQATPTDIEHVRESILYITTTISDCGELLEHMIAHSHRQEEILQHEKIFFVDLLQSFNADLKNWVAAHEKEIFGEISQLTQTQHLSPLMEGKALLELQKKRLQSHIENIHNTLHND